MSVRGMSLLKSFEPQRNVQNIKMAAKEAVKILNLAIVIRPQKLQE